MNEKRFTLDEYYHIEDNYEEKIYDGGEDTDCILDLLNELNDKNHNLRESRREIITANNEYRKELDELKSENKELKSKIKDLEFENEKKYREIMQLEQMLQDVER